MLEPSESDVLVLFLVLVVLPLVAYVLLGKWIEATKNRDKITLFAHLAAEEALRAEEMAVADVIPTIFSSKGELHECARCSAPARTRCSKCKSVRYCSGNCQIIHWRQIHKQECLQLETHKSSSFPLAVSFDEFSHGSGLFNENLNPQFFSHSLKQTLKDSAKLDNVVHPSTGTGAFATADYALFNKYQVSTFERRTSNESNRETQTRDNGSIYESSGYKAPSSPSSRVESKETFKRQKNVSGIGDHIYEQDESRSMMYEEVAGTRDTISSHGSNGTASIGIMKMMDLRKATKLTALATSGGSGDKFKKIKMLFPYEEFVKIFQGEVFGIFPRGLLNCGNRCY